MVSFQTEILWHLPLAKDVLSFSEHGAMDWQIRLRAPVRYISYYKDTYACTPNKNKYRNQVCLQRLSNYLADTCYSRGTQFLRQPEHQYSDRRSFRCSSLLLDKFRYNTLQFMIHQLFSHRQSTVWVAGDVVRKFTKITSLILRPYPTNERQTVYLHHKFLFEE